jgi:hypothetical protein
MPRNGSSVYSLPAGNPVIPGTVIATTWANTTLTDIATALTNSLSTDGSTASVSLAGKTMSGGTFSGPAVTGILTLTGGQIAFPAVQVPSANVNTLDDYEEGTWTPSLTFVTPGTLVVGYTLQAGGYTKIGRSVNVCMGIITNSYTLGTASGNMRITGLPFAPNNATNQCNASLSFQGINKATYTSLAWVAINALGTATEVIASGMGVARANIVTTDTASGTQVTLHSFMTYDAS